MTTHTQAAQAAVAAHAAEQAKLAALVQSLAATGSAESVADLTTANQLLTEQLNNATASMQSLIAAANATAAGQAAAATPAAPGKVL